MNYNLDDVDKVALYHAKAILRYCDLRRDPASMCGSCVFSGTPYCIAHALNKSKTFNEVIEYEEILRHKD